MNEKRAYNFIVIKTRQSTKNMKKYWYDNDGTQKKKRSSMLRTIFFERFGEIYFCNTVNGDGKRGY